MATRRSTEEVQRLLEEFQQSGETRAAFCRRQGIAVTTLDYYRHRRAPQARARLARVKLSAQSSDPSTTFVLVLRNGRRIETNGNFRDVDLTRLIRIADSE